MDRSRERLRELAAGLVRLHLLLLERERRAYEERHGPVGSHELLRLLLNHAQFAWLRSLSGLMARVDELADADEPIAREELERVLGQTHRLLKSGDSGAFQDRYRDALQESPDVVMAHAGITGVLRGP